MYKFFILMSTVSCPHICIIYIYTIAAIDRTLCIFPYRYLNTGLKR